MQVVRHPLIADLLTTLRDKGTPNAEFKRALADVTLFLGIEATRDLPTTPVKVETPLAMAMGERIAEPAPIIVPILRAGLGMSEPLCQLLPTASVGYVGIKRDEETALPEVYAERLPESIIGQTVIVTDPMLATAGSMIETIRLLKHRGATDIRALCLLAAPEGVQRLEEAHPDVRLYVAVVDDHLDEHAYIVPGLGDAGDRLFGRID